jgi:hypothetical protein
MTAARKNITSLKGWTIARIASSAGYYTMTLEKGGKTKIVTIGTDQVFDADGMRFEDNA